MKKIIILLTLVVIVLSLCSCRKNHSDISSSFSQNSSLVLNEDITDQSETENTNIENTESFEISENHNNNNKIEDSSKGNKIINGVPDSLVLRNVSIPNNFTYNIIHNYDSASHIDDVVLTAYHKARFGTHTKEYTYSYIYDKSSDLWSILNGESGFESENISFNSESFKSAGAFTGRFNRYESGSYEITIKDIDFDAKKATISYYLIFDSDSMVLQGTKAFEISKTTSGNIGIFIDYTRSMVVQFDQLFLFDIEKGLYAPD
ncbi:MAG: hypothetical protein IJT84_03630 [Clostridia bacterium]|nr:hypothetical protein [Clostridia bacterium]